jgi:hypothetical protein
LFDKGTELLPSYAINVFVGLHDEKLLELGPTEFIVGSHCLEPNAAMNKVDSAVSAILGRGDVLLYDYRICHRGTSNLCQPEEYDKDPHLTEFVKFSIECMQGLGFVSI